MTYIYALTKPYHKDLGIIFETIKGEIMKTLVAIALVLIAGTAKAERIVCDTREQFGPRVKVVVEDTKVTVTTGSKPTVHNNVDHVWDGHGSGLITAPGFSMKYDNHFGCIKNVLIVTPVNSSNLEVLEIAKCPTEECP